MNERGSISGLFVCLSMSLVAVVGLTVEGGRVVQAYGQLASLSASAARIGGQEIDGIQDGRISINSIRARSSMSRFLKGHDEAGSFVIGDKEVTVILRRQVSTTFLRLVGITSRTVEVQRTITVVKG
jgi:hypothetical protein